MKIPLKTKRDAKKFAIEFAKKVKKGDNIFLIGELGVGKTFFTRELVRKLGFADTVNSPSFKLINEYTQSINDFNILHFDLYRLDSTKDAEYLGWDDYLASADICIVEWAEKARDIWPLDFTVLYFEYDENFDARFVSVSWG
ncbi:MAG: tRNA (adenosine(37)-N6)-threonylcarbamoyltransferase complex ATPase subunit type 1 TsaE [bacterium]|nr:tRNA (adenosine(37)-N6)-threonylcarbamoyltransferase complex ATPase subunit type 1 TsaE [bacterium]